MKKSEIKKVVTDQFKLEFPQRREYMEKLWWCVTDWEDNFVLFRIGIVEKATGDHKSDRGDFILPVHFDSDAEECDSSVLWRRFNEFQYLDSNILDSRLVPC